MFQLIVTLLAIALGAAAALATVYYGGSAFSSGGVQANASALQSGASQISGAVALYSNQNAGSLPADVATLVPSYLSSAPVLPSSLSGASWTMGTATAAASGTGLTVDAAGAATPGPFQVVSVAGLSSALCSAVNQLAIGSTGSATSGGNQLFGCDANSAFYYTVAQN